MQIYLLRHGIAEDTRPGGTDADRALTAEGKEKLRRVLRRAHAEPSLILSSPYRRAVETAEIAAEALGYSGRIVRIEALVPHGSPHELWDEIRLRREEPAILLASHEPLMSTMASFLLNSPALQIDMKKAALVRIDCDHPSAKPSGILKWMLTPAVSE
jgi:phosphohistidine phosphatase